MTEENRREAERLALMFSPYGTKDEYGRYPERVAYVAGYAAACEAKRAEIEETDDALEEMTARLLRMAKECEATKVREQSYYDKLEDLHDRFQALRADYMDRGAAMRETGDMVRSLYAPKNERLNKENGKLKGEIERWKKAAELHESNCADLASQLAAEQARSARLIAGLEFYANPFNYQNSSHDPTYEPVALSDRGEIARRVLAEYTEGRG